MLYIILYYFYSLFKNANSAVKFIKKNIIIGILIISPSVKSSIENEKMIDDFIEICLAKICLQHSGYLDSA